MSSRNRKLSDSILSQNQGRLDLSAVLGRQISPITYDCKKPFIYYDYKKLDWTVCPDLKEKLSQRNITLKEFLALFNIHELIKNNNYIDTYNGVKIHSTPRALGEFRAPWKTSDTKTNYEASASGLDNIKALTKYRYEHPWVNQSLIKCTDWWLPSLEESLSIYRSYVKKLPPMEWGPDFPLMWTSTEAGDDKAYAIEFIEKARVREVALPKTQELTVRLVYARD